MLPLGDLWAGVCRAAPGESCAPDADVLWPLCHLGYARGQCPRFPAEDGGADAVRFTIRGGDERVVRLYYVLERDHHPLAHGSLEYSLSRAALANAPANPILCRQAEAYVASYLRRKNAR